MMPQVLERIHQKTATTLSTIRTTTHNQFAKGIVPVQRPSSMRSESGPRIGKPDTRDVGENVDAHGGNSDLIDHLLFGECFGCYLIVVKGSTELLERFDDAESVLP